MREAEVQSEDYLSLREDRKILRVVYATSGVLMVYRCMAKISGLCIHSYASLPAMKMN
jgi:hypothetical protein